MDPETEAAVGPLVDILRQINELSGAALDALLNGGGEAPEGGVVAPPGGGSAPAEEAPEA